MASIIAGVLFLVLFFGSFLTKRRFGLLAFALAAGYLLSATLNQTLTSQFSAYSNSLTSTSSLFIGLFLLFAPALVMFFTGPTYNARWLSGLSSLAFATLGIAIAFSSIASAFVLDSFMTSVMNVLASYGLWVVTGGMLLAIVDVMLTHFPNRRH